MSELNNFNALEAANNDSESIIKSTENDAELVLKDALGHYEKAKNFFCNYTKLSADVFEMHFDAKNFDEIYRLYDEKFISTLPERWRNQSFREFKRIMELSFTDKHPGHFEEVNSENDPFGVCDEIGGDVWEVLDDDAA